MKIRSLLLGSIAAAGLASGAQAADLGVLTSLDVCDSLGLSGLTISSDTNCLQITGGVSYEFNWGDYRSAANYSQLPPNLWADADDGSNDFATKGSTINPITGATESVDYDSKVEAWIRVLAAADSDFGQAKAIIGLRQVERYRQRDGGYTATDSATVADANGLFGVGLNSDSTAGVELNEAYVSVGDTTVLMAGLRKKGKDGSIANIDDDTPFNYIGLFGSTATDAGVLFKNGAPFLGGLSIQAVSDLGNGVSVGVGLENIDNRDGNALVGGGIAAVERNIMNGNYAGTLVGVVNYAGESVTAHLTAGAIGVLDGHVDSWFAHAGGTATFDNFKLRAALAYLRDDTNGLDASFWHGMVSGQATFDMFTLALSGEFKSTEVAGVKTDGYGLGASIGAQVTESVSLNLGGRYFHTNNALFAGVDQNMWQVEAQIVAALTETLKATGAVGVYGGDVVQASLAVPPLSGNDTAYYGSIGLDWAPGGDFTASVKGLATSEGAYKATFKAAKTFQ